jgi:ketosteroid isomerase-like protein
MAAQNTDVVSQLIARVNEDDIDAALRHITPDATLDWSLSEAPDSGVFRGRQAWHDWMSGRAADLVGAHFELKELVDVPPDRVMSVAYLRGRGRASGLEIDALGAAVWTLAGGRVTGIKMYQTRDEALAAAGVVA